LSPIKGGKTPAEAFEIDDFYVQDYATFMQVFCQPRLAHERPSSKDAKH